MKALLESLTVWVGQSAKRALERERPFIIAITGAVGKSSTKQLLAAILHADDPARSVRVTAKNYNNQLGLPLTIFQASAPGRSPFAWASLLWTAFLYRYGLRRTNIHTFVLEMGADHPGDLAYLTSIAKPRLSIVTAVTPEDEHWAPVHRANYASIDAVANEKATIVRNLDPKGTVVLNADDPRVIAMRHETTAHLVAFGTTEVADVEIVESRVRMAAFPSGMMPIGLEVTLNVSQQRQTIYLAGVFGRSMAFALAAAVAAGYALDHSLEEMSVSLERFQPLPGRARLIPGIKGTTLLDDTYNSSPVAVLSALRDLAAMEIDPSRQRRIVCLGEMRELGEQADMLHERMGMEAGRLKIDILAVTGAYAESIIRGAKMAGMRDEQLRQFADTPELGLWIQDILLPGDLVLAKASEGPYKTSEGYLKTKGVRMERVIKELMADPLQAEKLLCRQDPSWLVS